MQLGECRMDRFGAYARILFSVSCAFLLLLLVAPAGRADGVSFSSPTGDWGSTTHTSLITAGFTNVKFQMDSTEGGDQWQVTACSTAGVSRSGPCSANASILVGSDG